LTDTAAHSIGRATHLHRRGQTDASLPVIAVAPNAESARLRVVHVVEPLATGPLQSIGAICWGLRERFDFTVIHGERPNLPAVPRESFPPEVRLLPWRVGRAISLRDDWIALRQLKAMLSAARPDIVHAHSSKAGALVRLGALSTPLKVVYSPRGYSFLRRDVGTPTRLLYRGLEAALGRVPHLTVACGLAEYAEALQVACHVELVPNMIHLGDFASLTGPRQEDGPMTVAMCGEIRPGKNFSLFREIARLCPGSGMRFVWVGGGKPPPGPPLPDNLEITGWLPREAVLARMSQAQVFCHTSQWEGLSIALLEAMALGLPVLAWPAVGNRELVVEGETGYTCRTAEQFARHLCALAVDPGQRAALGAAGRARVARQHDAAFVAAQWASVYMHYERYSSRFEAITMPTSLRRGPGGQAPAPVDGHTPLRAHEGSPGPGQRPRLIYFLNAFDRGGAELGLLFLARNGFFAPFDALVLAICRGEGGMERELAASGLSAEALSPSARMTWRHMVAALLRLVGLLRRQRPAILVLSLPQANIVGRLAACLTGVPGVVSFEHNTRLSRRLFELCYLLLSPWVGMMFADCERTAELAHRRYVRRPMRHFVVPLCSFSRQPAGRPSNIPSLHSELRVASVGRLTRTKNHRCLIEAMALLHRQGIAVKAEIFGDGPLRHELQALATARGLAEVVDFRGFVPRWWEHSNANVFVVTSLHEGLCIVALEAMWAGIPVIAPNIGGIVDYGTDANMFLLPDLEPETVADRLRDAMAAPELAARRTVAAKHTIAEMFSEEVVAERLRDISDRLSAGADRDRAMTSRAAVWTVV
jgi:glycosyltransferase involved in cell wall biosynthesis